MKILEYQVVAQHVIEPMNQAVSDLIKEGWQPYGSMTVVPENSESYGNYLQPMVKYAVEETDVSSALTRLAGQRQALLERVIQANSQDAIEKYRLEINKIDVLMVDLVKSQDKALKLQTTGAIMVNPIEPNFPFPDRPEL